MLNRRTLACCLVATLLCLPMLVQSQADKDMLERIRKEEATNSQILKTEHMLTDVYGPRLTGSPNHKAAAEWALKQMTAWGLQNAHLEPWDFGHVGWLNERFTGHDDPAANSCLLRFQICIQLILTRPIRQDHLISLSRYHAARARCP